MIDFVDLGELALRFGINIVAMGILVFALYYRRHGDRLLATTAAMFNVFGFAVLAKLTSVDFGLAAGFGLFAILALFNLRSEPIGRVEIAYFFGSVAIAVICSIEGVPMGNTLAVATLTLICVYVIDHPRLLRGSRAITVTLDGLDPKLLSDTGAMKHVLGERFGVVVTSFDVISMNLVNDRAVINLTYLKPDDEAHSAPDSLLAAVGVQPEDMKADLSGMDPKSV